MRTGDQCKGGGYTYMYLGRRTDGVSMMLDVDRLTVDLFDDSMIAEHYPRTGKRYNLKALPLLLNEEPET